MTKRDDTAASLRRWGSQYVERGRDEKLTSRQRKKFGAKGRLLMRAADYVEQRDRSEAARQQAMVLLDRIWQYVDAQNPGPIWGQDKTTWLIEEHKRLSDRLALFGTVLREAPRIGAERDEPEGSRYIQISETLVQQLLEKDYGQG